MKQWIYEHYPHLKEMGESQAVYNELTRVIIEA
jgi:hypothetical protein